ncbi:MAG TPA: glycine cleavage system protein GcvH [Thiotrichaceae bacterium]|nr:glycine cleavage system protein GcvH [Thiotrichaceae bacterium]
MNNIPHELKYTTSHEWLRDNGDGTVTVGITDHAQELLGDIVFVELPEVDTAFDSEEAVGVVESVKAASDYLTPLSGTVTAVNETLDDGPEQVNSDPYNDGWIYTLKPDDIGELAELMDADAYAAICED